LPASTSMRSDSKCARRSLVLGERRDAGDQHAGLAARPQPHIDLVQPAGRRVHRQQVHQALSKAHEEHLVVERART